MTHEAAKVLHGFVALGGAGVMMDLAEERKNGTHWWPSSEAVSELRVLGFVRKLKRKNGHNTWSVTDIGFEWCKENPL